MAGSRCLRVLVRLGLALVFALTNVMFVAVRGMNMSSRLLVRLVMKDVVLSARLATNSRLSSICSLISCTS